MLREHQRPARRAGHPHLVIPHAARIHACYFPGEQGNSRRVSEPCAARPPAFGGSSCHYESLDSRLARRRRAVPVPISSRDSPTVPPSASPVNGRLPCDAVAPSAPPADVVRVTLAPRTPP